MSTEIHTKHLRCASADCGRTFPAALATKHVDGYWDEAYGRRIYIRTYIDCCPYCAGETDEVHVCNACLNAEPVDGADQCSRCIEMEEADWKERKARYDANEPDCERARKALTEVPA